MRLPILAGPLRGRWWLPGSRGKVLRVLAGTYEPEQTRLFLDRSGPGDVVLDVGAHAGYYTLLASTRVGRSGAVWAFEPNPANNAALRRNVAINRCANVHVEGLAVSDTGGTARFQAGTGSGTGHLSEAGAIEVATVTLDEFCARRAIAPTLVKVDVEGAEARVLEGGREVLASHRPTLFLSTHGPAAHRACLEMLAGLGYAASPIDSSNLETATEVLAVPEGETPSR